MDGNKETETKEILPDPREINTKIYRQGFRHSLHLAFKHFDATNNSGGDQKLLRILRHVFRDPRKERWSDQQILDFFRTPPPETKLQPCNTQPFLCDDGNGDCVRCPETWNP